MEHDHLESRLQAVEDKLTRVETLLVNLSQKLDTPAASNADEMNTAMQEWVTDYVSLRLQQLVPHTCDHLPQTEGNNGPYMEGTDVPCTDEVVHRVGRIPIPFVREMVVQRVAQKAREENISRVDVAYFEQAATF